jgi:RNA polymerase sigma factor (sigma-70 family)
MTPWAVINPARLAGSGLLRTQSDSRLVDLVRAGNDRAFEAIVLRYHKPLLRHCRRLLPAGRAEDAVQQALLRALEAMRADERELQLGPWLHRIAHNTAIDSLRRMDSHWEELDERMDGVEPTHAAVERRARFNSVMSDMGELPERQRRALVLRELEGRSYDEIAATLGVTGDGVRQLLNRARNAMRAAATALVPPALVGRIAGSQASVRIAELMDPPASALMAKATAAAAAGAVALFAVTGPPTGDGNKVPQAEASPRTPAAQERAEAGARAAQTAAQPTDPASNGREDRKADSRHKGTSDGKARERRGAGRAAAGPGPAGGGDGGPAPRARVTPPTGDDDDGPAARPRRGSDDDDDGDDDAPAGGRRGGSDDDDGPAPGQSGGGGDDDDDGPPAPNAPAGGDGGGDDGAEEGTVAAAPSPPPGGGDDEAEAPAPPPSPTPPAPQPQSEPADDDGGEAND